MKSINIFLIIFLFVFGTTMALGFLSAGEWQQPRTDSPNGGFIRPVLDEGASGVYYTSRELRLNDDFLVGANNFYVNTDNGRVGIGTIAPAATLDISGGGMQLLPVVGFPPCNPGTVGSLLFSASMPYVCTSAGWVILHADTNNDGRY